MNETMRQIGRRFFLLDGAISERVRRRPDAPIVPELGTPGLLYSSVGREILGDIYRSYFVVARDFRIPLLTIAPSWRADKERLPKLDKKFSDANLQAIRFLQELREPFIKDIPILIAGDVGCRGDAYKPEEALDEQASQEFHEFQIGKLAAAGADLIFCLTLPAVSEAIGIARACASRRTPYLISFVIRPDGSVLDGTPLKDAIERVDSSVEIKPVGYTVNCVHISSLATALSSFSSELHSRFLGIKANPSARTPEELENLTYTDAGDPMEFGKSIANAVVHYNLKLAGGCCGTDDRHIRELAALVKDNNQIEPALKGGSF